MSPSIVSCRVSAILLGLFHPYYHRVVTPGALIMALIRKIRSVVRTRDGDSRRGGHRFARAVQRQRRQLRRAGSIEYRGQAQLDCFGDMACESECGGHEKERIL